MTETKVIDDKLMGDIKELLSNSAKNAVSVWRIHAAPKTKDGMRGARRAACFLMPVTAEAGSVMTRFIAECSRTDGADYESAEVEVVDYQGWAWLPGFPLGTDTKTDSPA